jgi:hypothetical protein
MLSHEAVYLTYQLYHTEGKIIKPKNTKVEEKPKPHDSNTSSKPSQRGRKRNPMTVIKSAQIKQKN